MKVGDLIKRMRETAQADRIIVPGHVSRRNMAWPVCLTCGREPFSVNLEDIGSNRIEIKVKCGHKPYWQMTDKDPVFEDSIKIDVPIGTNRHEHVSWALKHGRYFDPTAVPK